MFVGVRAVYLVSNTAQWHP